jgi:hypothetical protein
MPQRFLVTVPKITKNTPKVKTPKRAKMKVKMISLAA